MSGLVRKILYFLLAFLMVVDFYLIFNAGNPNSFLRLLISDTAYDVTITVVLSIAIGIISLSLIRDGDQNSLKSMIDMNKQYIMKLKKENKSSDEIADSFLKEMGGGRFFRFFLKNRVKRYIGKIQ